MVSWSLCCGNPGALNFMYKAYMGTMAAALKAESAFARAEHFGIKGDKLYMIWNDCCDRDTEKAILALNTLSEEVLFKKLNYEKGQGIKINMEELQV